ncbi:MFS transporter [Ralstonia solanacearum species complex bacterium KE056]|uniref:MFS transporter n=1 Tax=Ralstonia solanacearum species complex bacterium KE056 TaxID=3119585 RepID=UPI002FC374DF
MTSHSSDSEAVLPPTGPNNIQIDVAIQDNQQGAWQAVWALGFCVAALITSELLPVSLLTPMAANFGVSEGVAGQTVTTTAIVAMLASLVVSAATQWLDRRTLLLGLSMLMTMSNVLAACAPNFAVLLFGRLILGIALGGFWSMASALAMRLVPPRMVPRALSIIFSGVTVASIVAAPASSYIEGWLGWRGVFWIASLLGALSFIFQYVSLPSIKPIGSSKLGALLKVLIRPRIGSGMLAVVLMCGHYAFFTYLRPLIEAIPGSNAQIVSLILFVFGVGNLAGTMLSGFLLERSLRVAMTSFLVLIAVLAIFVSNVQSISVLATGIALWGFSSAVIVVGWSTWLTRALPEDAESGGGLLVAAYQIAITLGASLGGIAFEKWHSSGVLDFCALMIALAAIVSVAALRGTEVAPRNWTTGY